MQVFTGIHTMKMPFASGNRRTLAAAVALCIFGFAASADADARSNRRSSRQFDETVSCGCECGWGGDCFDYEDERADDDFYRRSVTSVGERPRRSGELKIAGKPAYLKGGLGAPIGVGEYRSMDPEGYPERFVPQESPKTSSRGRSIEPAELVPSNPNAASSKRKPTHPDATPSKDPIYEFSSRSAGSIGGLENPNYIRYADEPAPTSPKVVVNPQKKSGASEQGEGIETPKIKSPDEKIVQTPNRGAGKDVPKTKLPDEKIVQAPADLGAGKEIPKNNPEEKIALAPDQSNGEIDPDAEILPAPGEDELVKIVQGDGEQQSGNDIEKAEKAPSIKPAASAEKDAEAAKSDPPKDTSSELRKLLKKANAGNPDAMYEVATIFFTGEGVEQDSARAAMWLEKAADAGHQDAAYTLALMYQNSDGVERDAKKAEKYYEMGVNRGDINSMFNLGLLYVNAKESDFGKNNDNYSKAYALFEKCAAKRHPGCGYYAGMMRYYGDGTDQDEKDAMKILESAALNGSDQAMFFLGSVAMKEGKDDPARITKARSWLKKCSELGNTDCLVNYGIMNERGIGAAANFKKASECFAKAADAGDAEGAYNIGLMYYKGKGLERDFAKAKKYLEQAAAGGSSGAMVVLGLMSHDGSGMDTDMNGAVEWWKKAAEEYSSKDAMYLLGVIYRDGADKFAPDSKESAKWFKEGCNAGSEKCCGEIKVGLMNKSSSKSSRTDSSGQGKLRLRKLRPF